METKEDGWISCYDDVFMGSVPMGAYLILQQVNIPLQIQPQIFGFFSLVSWAQVLYYGHNYSCTKTTLLCISMVLLFGGLETLLILTLRIPHSKGITWPDLVVGIVAAVLLSAGLLPPYFELWKRDGRVIGFNWVFLSIDTLGGLFSLFALAAQGTFDLLGGIMYILVVVLEAGIYISHIVWRIRYRKLRKEARESGKSIDDLLAAPSQRDNAGETRDLEAGLFDYDGSKEFEQGSTRVQSPTVPCVEQSQVAGEKC